MIVRASAEEKRKEVTKMSVAGPVVPRHPAPLAGAGGDDGDDPAFPIRRRLISGHEADVEPINRSLPLQYACELCRLGFVSLDSVRAHHGNQPEMFMRMIFDPRYTHVFIEFLTPAQVDAALHAYLHGP